MRHRFVLLALLAALVLVLVGCTADPPPDPPPDPTAAPTTTARSGTARPAPDGVIPADRRQPAPALQVTAFDGRTVTMAGFRGQPVVVNFFESW